LWRFLFCTVAPFFSWRNFFLPLTLFFCTVSLAYIGSVWISFLIDFQPRNAEPHPNASIFFPTILSTARFWAAAIHGPHRGHHPAFPKTLAFLTLPLPLPPTCSTAESHERRPDSPPGIATSPRHLPQASPPGPAVRLQASPPAPAIRLHCRSSEPLSCQTGSTSCAGPPPANGSCLRVAGSSLRAFGQVAKVFFFVFL
jgi:hypothetical protein